MAKFPKYFGVQCSYHFINLRITKSCHWFLVHILKCIHTILRTLGFSGLYHRNDQFVSFVFQLRPDMIFEKQAMAMQEPKPGEMFSWIIRWTKKIALSGERNTILLIYLMDLEIDFSLRRVRWVGRYIPIKTKNNLRAF